MNAAALPRGLRRFSLADIAPEPWRNGGGVTRPIGAGFAAGSRSDWVWRASVADLDRPGPFSLLAGIDRRSALVDAQPVVLRSATGELHFVRRGDVQCYDGDTPWEAALPGGPSRLFNLMTRRGAASGRVRSHERGATLEPSPAAVVLVGGGRFGVRWWPGVAGVVLQAGEGLRLDGWALPLQVEALVAGGCLVHAAVEGFEAQSAVRG